MSLDANAKPCDLDLYLIQTNIYSLRGLKR